MSLGKQKTKRNIKSEEISTARCTFFRVNYTSCCRYVAVRVMSDVDDEWIGLGTFIRTVNSARNCAVTNARGAKSIILLQKAFVQDDSQVDNETDLLIAAQIIGSLRSFRKEKKSFTRRFELGARSLRLKFHSVR
jgi:hypothetical protein